ncbi:MAG: hypothetical protein M1276_02290 [Deltaproteobacteria bacterium]|jgi:hypothetical protein|nr:hypothetical protein [Deltaproteobacteria bacterium]MDA8157661.1 hypothetical protein [Deltaproteobacteria bacterium]
MENFTDNINKEKITSKRNNLNNLNNYYNAAISADDHLGGRPLSIKETLIWPEESKIFFYKIKE